MLVKSELRHNKSPYDESERQDDDVPTRNDTAASAIPTLQAAKIAGNCRKSPNTVEDDTKSQSKIVFFEKTTNSEREGPTEEVEDDTSEEIDSSSSESEVMPESPEIVKENDNRKRKQKAKHKHKKKK